MIHLHSLGRDRDILGRDGATSCGIDCISALNSRALDSRALDSPALNPLALDSPALDSPALDSPALDPPALDSTTTVACVASPPLPPAVCQSPFSHVRRAACCLSVGLVCRPPTARGIRSQLGPIHPSPPAAHEIRSQLGPIHSLPARPFLFTATRFGFKVNSKLT